MRAQPCYELSRPHADSAVRVTDRIWLRGRYGPLQRQTTHPAGCLARDAVDIRPTCSFKFHTHLMDSKIQAPSFLRNWNVTLASMGFAALLFRM